VQPAAQEKLPHPMPAALPILAGIIASATQVANRFFFGRRRTDFRQHVRAQQLAQFSRVAAIRLDPLTGLARDQR